MTMDREVDKINRTVHYLHAQQFDSEDKTGNNNTWQYDRAPDGYKFILHSIEISTGEPLTQNNGIFAMFDGHEYTHWNLFPGVQSNELLTRAVMSDQYSVAILPLNNWECKEFTLAVRSQVDNDTFKICAIVWFYLRKMTPDETKMYAVLQPRGSHYRKGGPSTLTEGEETD